MSSATTRGVRVDVQAHFLAEQSDPDAQQWVFAYRVTIHNDRDDTVQLLTRHWRITNGRGQVQEVEGPGVVGRQPMMRPGEGFQYVSGCPLDTPIGTMEGRYTLVSHGGETFDVDIAPFVLADPLAVN